MAIKHIKDYYQQVEKLYLELASDLAEMEKDFKNGDCTEEELQNLLIPVNNIKENYERLSYILFLFYQPKKKSKKEKYEMANKDLKTYFEKQGTVMEKELENESASLATFRKLIKEKFNHE